MTAEPMRPKTSQPTQERRTRERTPQDARVTMLIQTILSNPPGALALLERELKEGVKPADISSVLELAAEAVWRRGVPLAASVDWIRERLAKAGYRV